MQDRDAILAGDARLTAFAGLRGWQFGIFGAALTLLVVGGMLATAVLQTSADGPKALPIDFRVFWAAGQLFVGGEPLAVLDNARLGATHNVDPEDWMPWLYPPGFLLFVAPFGLLSFPLALFLWTTLSVGLAAWAFRPFVAGVMPLWLGLSLAPTFLPSLLIGQTSLFWLAGVLAALAALRGERWVLAGIFIGCLTLKPQLGLIIPVALLAVGAWRTIFAATATTLVLAVLPTLAVGPEFWAGLQENVVTHGRFVVERIDNLRLMIGPLSLLAGLGMAPEAALKVQWVLSVMAAVTVFAVWRSPRAGFDVKAAVLLAGSLLSSPYLWYYEGAFLAAIALFLFRAGMLRVRFPDMAILLLLWLGSGLQVIQRILMDEVDLFLGAPLITALLLLTLALGWRAVLKPRAKG
ncbi:MAG: DUF2029 domain-containing protein [Rhodobacteraceae bacterium]|jgi:hypothetical protein|nr:DUF2029 domain-containing protein [Paracoccaceae bacterium]